MTISPLSQVIGIILVSLVSSLQTTGVGAEEVKVDKAVKRINPGKGELLPVEKPNPGKIYNHYSEKLKRRVWAFYLANGKFSHAMGAGTTQNIKMFEFPYSTEQQQQIISQVAPRWAKSMESIGSEAYVRLTDQEIWQLVQHPTMPSLYDLETGRRWEWHGGRRVAVGHTTGYRWRLENGKYRPEIEYSYQTMALPISSRPCCNP